MDREFNAEFIKQILPIKDNYLCFQVSSLQENKVCVCVRVVQSRDIA